MMSNATNGTPPGMPSISGKCSPEFLAGLRFDAGMGNLTHYSSIVRDVEILQKVARDKDGRMALAIVNEEIIVGYIACWYPKPQERWSKLGELMYEMGAIEVSRNFRRLGIARRMIAMVLREDFFEDKISYLNSFSWHWDLDGTGVTIDRYRKMMAELMEGHGFLEHYTNEPNIAIRKENIFMARIGSRVIPSDKKRFRNLRFGVTDRWLSGSPAIMP